MTHEFPRAERILAVLRDGLIAEGSLSRDSRVKETSCAQFFGAKAGSPLSDELAVKIVRSLGQRVRHGLLPGWKEVQRRSEEKRAELGKGPEGVLEGMLSPGKLLDVWRRQWNYRFSQISLFGLSKGGSARQHLLRTSYLRLGSVDLAARVGAGLWLSQGAERALLEVDRWAHGSAEPFWTSDEATRHYVNEHISAACRGGAAKQPSGKDWAGALLRIAREPRSASDPAPNTVYKVAAGARPDWKTLHWICATATQQREDAESLQTRLLWAYLARHAFREVHGAFTEAAQGEVIETSLEFVRCVRGTIAWLEGREPPRQAIAASVVLGTGTLSAAFGAARPLLLALGEEAPNAVWRSVYQAVEHDWAPYLHEIASPDLGALSLACAAVGYLQQGDVVDARERLERAQLAAATPSALVEAALAATEHTAGNPRGRDKHFRRALALGWHRLNERS